MSMLDELSVQKKAILDEFKKRIADDVPAHLRNDIYLYLRFLKARDFNLNLAENMLRNHLVWRKANHIDSILTDFVPAEVVIKHLPLTRIGFDKQGAPIRYFEFGEMDSKGILKSVKKTECIKAIIQCFEEDVAVMRDQTVKLGKPIEQWTYILNFENYSLSKATHKPTLETLINLFLAYEANYPERLKAAYIINASNYFNLVFSVIKPLLSGATVKKISIFSKDGWREELLKNIDPEILPAFLGGSMTDPDGNPLCKETVKHASLVPEEYYLTKSIRRLSTQPGVQKLTVARMSKANLKLDVAEPGSLIEWEFETDGKDIGFCLLFKNSTIDKSGKELVPNQRIDTQFVSEVGMYQCDTPGTYILVFDNSYSWMHEKEVFCKASVVNPKVISVEA